MRPSRILEPGTVGINVKGRVDRTQAPGLGALRAGHVWYVLPSGKLATTGASRMVLYGEVDPDEYLPGRSCVLLRTVDALTSAQLATIETCHRRLATSGSARIFGLWQFAWIKAFVAWDADLAKSRFRSSGAYPRYLFCSQAVAYAFWMAGVPIGKMFGWQDWTAIFPETILQEAQAVAAMVTSGEIDRHCKPCYYLRSVQDRPFHFTLE